MATPITRIESFVREVVPADKQPDLFLLLRELRHHVLHEAACAIAEQATADRWGTEVRHQFSSHMRAVLLKHLSKQEFLTCKEPESSQRSEVEI
jgi:hypothetical protein